MKWVLVLIVLTGVDPNTKQSGVYNSIMDCFYAREILLELHEEGSSNPAQAVCIRTANA